MWISEIKVSLVYKPVPGQPELYGENVSKQTNKHTKTHLMEGEVRKLSSLDFTKCIFHLQVFKIASTDGARAHTHTTAHYTSAVNMSTRAALET